MSAFVFLFYGSKADKRGPLWVQESSSYILHPRPNQGSSSDEVPEHHKPQHIGMAKQSNAFIGITLALFGGDGENPKARRNNIYIYIYIYVYVTCSRKCADDNKDAYLEALWSVVLLLWKETKRQGGTDDSRG